ncbi:hypothetical protein ACAH01_02140 [Halomicrobium sp. HM KBTZ05]|uniref:hypothetical protein n=1 Tax=Halomicrobium sp. HM KBTZ05 TaxID=3242663 RepID=UPI003556E7E0
MRDEQRRIAQSPLSPTPEVRTYETNGQEVTLNEGFVEEQDGYYRGYGWEYIDETSELTQDDIGRILENGDRETTGEVTYVIGDGTDAEEQAILEIIDGTLMAAGTGSSTVQDDCNDIVNVEDRGDHATRDGKPVDSKSTLRELIRSEVVRIVDVASKRYYIAQYGGGYVLIAAQGNPGYRVVQTILTASTADNIYRTIEKALKDIPGNEEEKDTVYDSENGVDC